jgi:POT family proton-dependent oligopeptide transporter
MAVDHRTAFYAALTLDACGCGVFKPNLTAMLSQLYAADDPRRDRAFLAFYAVTCVGAALAPIVCGFLADRLGFRFGFTAAAIGMAITILVLRLAWPARGGAVRRAAPAAPAAPPSRARDLTELKAAVVVSLFAVVFWIAAEQAGNTLTVFADQEVDRVIQLGAWSWKIPTSSLLALNPIALLILMPLLSRMWRRAALRGREPSTALKMAIGVGLMAVAFGWLILTSLVAAHRGDQVGVISLAVFYVIASAAELYVLPSGMSLVTKVARPTRRGTALAPWFLAGFVGNILAGRLAELWGQWSHTMFFGAVAVLCAGAAVCFGLGAARLERMAANAADGSLEDVDLPGGQASPIVALKEDSP